MNTLPIIRLVLKIKKPKKEKHQIVLTADGSVFERTISYLDNAKIKGPWRQIAAWLSPGQDIKSAKERFLEIFINNGWRIK